MTEALATFFEGKEVRIIEDTINKDGSLWIPIADIAKAWGIDRSTPDQMINRNMEVFGDVSRTVLDDTSNPVVCLNERGMYLMMGKISAGRLKNPDARAAIIRFQKWFPELIQQYRKKEIVQTTAPDRFELDEVVAYDLQEAREIAKLTDTDPKVLQAAVLRKHQYPELADAIRPANLPALASAAPETSQPGIWMTPTDIGQECALSARQVNSWLYNHDFQYPDGQVWRLTAKGEAYGEEYLFTTPYKHTETRIRWHRSILVASGLKRPLPESQMVLPAHAGVS